MQEKRFAEVRLNLLDLVEDNAARLVDAEKTHAGGDQREQSEQLPVGAGQLGNVIVLHALGGVVAGVRFLILGSRRRFASTAARRGLLLEQRLFRAHGGDAGVRSDVNLELGLIRDGHATAWPALKRTADDGRSVAYERRLAIDGMRGGVGGGGVRKV